MSKSDTLPDPAFLDELTFANTLRATTALPRG
jgi:hypothetical protein